MATFRKRGSTWRAEIKLRGARESATFDTKGQAVAWATEREAEIMAGVRGTVIRRTVTQALERYAEKVSPTHKGERWERVRLKKLGRDLAFRGRVMSEVTKHDISAWRDEMLGKLAPASARREYGLLRAVFTVARDEWSWLRVSPFDSVTPPPAGKPRTRRVSDDEVAKLLDALGYRPWDPPVTASHFIALAVLLALATAMRQSEILGLTDGAIDLERRVITLSETKNGERRHVPISQAAAQVLGVTREFPVAAATFDALFRRARARANLDDLHFHDLRREAATRMAAKVDAMTLAKITGHRDLKVLLSTYYAPSMSEVAPLLD